MEVEVLIKALRDEGRNYAKDYDSPIGHISHILLEAADVIEEQMKLSDSLHDAMHHALQCPEVDCFSTEELCEWWENSRI